jgi:hypothetical protein
VLVLSGIHLRPEFVCCFPECLFEIVCHTVSINL